MAANEDSSMTSTTPPIQNDGPSAGRCHAVAGQMTYYIYENWQAGPHRAKIHQGSCRHCNGGLGRTQGGYDPSRGKWHGPYNDVSAAREAQQRMHVVSRSEWQVCMKARN